MIEILEIEWFWKLQNVKYEDIEPIDLIPLVEWIWDRLKLTKFHEVEEIISWIENNMHLYDAIVLVCVIRNGYVFRDKINNWYSFLKNVKQELINRKLNHKMMLRGLPEAL